jgi:hypothetical protein
MLGAAGALAIAIGVLYGNGGVDELFIRNTRNTTLLVTVFVCSAFILHRAVLYLNR